MIKKINIKKFGLFSDFQWNFERKKKKEEKEKVFFQKENIIYGRNYSGKTTLSRIIRSLETKNISEKYENPTFEIELYGNSKINQSNYTSNSLNVRVFNEDFIKENLSFIIDPNGKINPFAILGENTEIQPKIDALSKELGNKEEDKETGLYKNLKDLKNSVISKQNEYDTIKRNLDNQLTNKAREIKANNGKYGDINYNITKINNDIDLVKSSDFTPITPEKEKQNEQIIKEEIKQEIKYSLFEQFEHLKFSQKAKGLLSKNILDANKIEELIKNASLNNWVKTGYDLHKDDRENCKCGFCGNIVSQTRWAELDKHFDEETEKLKRDLISFQKEISDEITKVPNLLPNKALFYAEFQNDAESILNRLQEEYDKYKTDLETIKGKIKEREENILQISNFEFEPTFSADNFEVLKQSFSDLVEKNSKNAENLSSKQEIAKKELRLLEIKRFLDTIDYDKNLVEISKKEQIYEEEKRKVKQLNTLIEEKESERKSLETQLKDEKKGAEKVNFYLNNFFGHQNLTLEAITNESDKSVKFEIKRDGRTAYHLSEGECSLVAFCYFMAKLDDIETSGHKPIIFIDDPISSLDSNHIFYVYSLIYSELFCKNKFEQIFISTHNLEFLKYLKRLQKSENSKREHFIIHRNKENTEILLMPNYMKSYVTEFNYLFHQIHKCANANLVDDSNYHIFYNFGNNARKFLEVLLFYKYPSNQGNEKTANNERLKKYFGDDNQSVSLTERINNEYSHLEEVFTRSENIIENNVEEMQKVAQFILRKMEEKDNEQYNALLQSIGINSVN